MTDSHSISCSECQARLEEFALDALPGDVCADIANHLKSGCGECNQQLGEIVSDLSQLAHTLPIDRPPMRGERALLNRIAVGQLREEAAGLATPAASLATISDKPSGRGIWAAALVLAATIIGIAAWTARHNGSESVAQQAPWVELQRRVAEADAEQRFTSIPHLRFASLKMPAPSVAFEGYIVRDELAKQWHVYALHLPELPTGHAYQLWFDMGDSHFVRAGMGEMSGDGTMSCVIDAPPDRASIRGLAISDEPSTGSDSPTGKNLVESPLP